MKFRCPECGELVYSKRELTNCPSCDSGMDDVTPKAEKVDCPVSGKSVRVVNGIPACDHFKLTNSVGSRCTHGELPASCESCGLPFYNPRVGVTSQ